MAKHRLVAIGDSLTQGFFNGAIERSEWSYPAMIAEAMGADPFNNPPFGGPGGIPLNLEWLIRRLGERFGDRIDALELPAAILTVHRSLSQIEDYWERGPGSLPLQGTTHHHNLAVWGFEIGDALDLTAHRCDIEIPAPKDNWLAQVPERALYRTARRVLNPSASPDWNALSALDVARRIAQDGGIENLIVVLGANHALGAMTRLEIRLSTTDELNQPTHERRANLYRQEHFRILYERLLEAVDRVGAERVFLGTVPHVTIPPVARGVGVQSDGYYEYYTRPWIWDTDFDPERHTALSGADARQVDQHIDGYNEIIRAAAESAPNRHLIDIGGLLDGLAFRRRRGAVGFSYPAGLIEALRRNADLSYLVDADGHVRLDTRFMRTRTLEGTTRLIQGGLFSLDGMHPTITGTAIVAHGILQILRQAGVSTQRDDVDWDRVLEADTLLNDPPPLLSDLHALLTFLDRRGLLSAVLDLF
jgi:lysophospholipase L1-like esterase